MFGRMMSETLGKAAFWLTFVGAYCIFMPMHFWASRAAIRRYAELRRSSICSALQPLHRFMTVAAFVTAAAQLSFSGIFSAA